jgi:hypothetical protein
MVFVDPLQGVSYCCLFFLELFVEFIGRDKTREHTYNAYIVKLNNGSKEKNIRQLNQDVHVWNVWWICMVANLIIS